MVQRVKTQTYRQAEKLRFGGLTRSMGRGSAVRAQGPYRGVACTPLYGPPYFVAVGVVAGVGVGCKMKFARPRVTSSFTE